MCPLLAETFLFCYESDFMKSLTKENWKDMNEAFNSTTRYMYMDDLLNIDNILLIRQLTECIPQNFKTTSSRRLKRFAC